MWSLLVLPCCPSSVHVPCIEPAEQPALCCDHSHINSLRVKLTLILYHAQPRMRGKRIRPIPPCLTGTGLSLTVPQWRAQHWLWPPALLDRKSDWLRWDIFQMQSDFMSPSREVSSCSHHPAELSGTSLDSVFLGKIRWIPVGNLEDNEMKRTKARGRL